MNEYYFQKAAEMIGVYQEDYEEYGDTIIGTGRYLSNEDEVEELANKLEKEDKKDDM